MNEIAINYYLIIPTIVCVVALTTILYFRKILFRKNKTLWISLTIFFTIYLLIVGDAAFNDIYYQWNVNRFDLNKDVMFSGQEITDEQDETMRKLINDTGRNFSFITGFVFSIIISIPVYVIGRFIKKIQMN